MTFLHTIFLAALAAAAIPLLLHLLSRQRLPLIPFSTLKFLQTLQKRKSRKIRIRQLILLALRTLAVVTIVLTFARPAMQSAGSTGSAAAVEMVIILDNSLNSASQTLDGQNYRLAVDRVLQLFELAGSNDQISLVLTTDPANIKSVISGAKTLIVDWLEGTTPTYFAPRVSESLLSADSIFTASTFVNRELYIVSSFYGSTWDTVTVIHDANLVRRFLLPVGPKALENVSIVDLKLIGSIIQQDQPLELETGMVNHSPRPMIDAPLSIYLRNERVAQRSVDIPANGAVRESFSLKLHETGLIDGMLKLESTDPLSVDNKFYFIVDVPERVRLLAVAPDSSQRLILSALFEAEQAGGVHLTLSDPGEWETIALTDYDVLLLAGVRTVSSGAAFRIRDFVENGGGVILFPGRSSDLTELSRGVWKQLGFAGARGTIEGGGVTWGKLDLEHPIFEGVFEKKRNPRYPSLKFCIDLALGSDDFVIIPLSNSRPFLIERVVGSGRALSFATPIDLSSSDLVLSGIFAPMIFRCVIYAASPIRDEQSNFVTGQRYEVILQLSDVNTADMVAPDGTVTELPPRPVVGGVEYSTGLISVPGIYKLNSLGTTVAKYAANIPWGESRLSRSPASQLKDRLDAILIKSNVRDLAATIHKIRFGRELWKPFVFVFLILLISETLLGRTWRKNE